MTAKPVFTPLMSAAEVTTVIVPSESTRQTAAAGSSPPGQWPAAMPIPSFSGSESRLAHSGCSLIRSSTSRAPMTGNGLPLTPTSPSTTAFLQAQLDRVEPERRGELVEERLEREGGGRRSGRAVGAEREAVRLHAVAAEVVRLPVVRAGDEQRA